MLSRAALGDRQPPRLNTALGGGQGKGEGLPPGAKTMGFGMQRSTRSSRNLLDPPADDPGTNEGEMAGGSGKEGSRRTASPHPSDQISAVVGSADTSAAASAAAPPSPDSIGCWHAFEFGALYCESFSAESVRLLRKQQKRTHQMCCAWLANRQQLLEAFEAADEASANGGVSVDSSGGDDGSTGRYIDAQQVAVDGTEILYYAGNAVATPLAPYAYIVANAVDALFTVANGGSPLISEVTSGEVEIYLGICNLVDLGKVIEPSAT